MDFTNDNYISLAQKNFHKMKSEVLDYIASTGRTVIADNPVNGNDIRLFAGRDGLCDRLFFVQYPDDGRLEICILEYFQKDQYDEGYLGSELDVETLQLALHLAETLVKLDTKT